MPANDVQFRLRAQFVLLASGPVVRTLRPAYVGSNRSFRSLNAVNIY